MNMPGFTAEASLSNARNPYRTAGQAGLSGKVVQPASDAFPPDWRTPVLFSSVYTPSATLLYKKSVY